MEKKVPGSNGLKKRNNKSMSNKRLGKETKTSKINSKIPGKEVSSIAWNSGTFP